MDKRQLYYRLDENNIPIPCSMEEWCGAHKRVGDDDITDKIRVSTIFLGLDHNWADGPVILFETMIFGGKHDEYQERYSTWDEAVEGHKKAIELVKQDLPNAGK